MPDPVGIIIIMTTNETSQETMLIRNAPYILTVPQSRNKEFHYSFMRAAVMELIFESNEIRSPTRAEWQETEGEREVIRFSLD